MLAQTGDSFLAAMEEDESLDFWTVAERLAQADYIRPLASRGIVGQRTAATGYPGQLRKLSSQTGAP